MKNDIATIYVAYSDKIGGKRRPVLLVDEDDTNLVFYRITSKYANKSENIKQFYFPIEDWKEAGLNMKSWIDTKEYKTTQKDKVVYKKIGKLSLKDKDRLSDFLEHMQSDRKEIGIEDSILKEVSKNSQNIYKSIENMYLSNDIVAEKFSERRNVEQFYFKHKTEIKKCISELSISTGVSKKELLGKDYKRNSCVLSYKLGLSNILKKIEDGSLDYKSSHEINNQKNDLEIE
ncbi:type II toxin-antitoxin system PemK/MazF family toxin [Enterococcus cecorum]|uniref:type II toxin-antitoxin system PemK/MazF family toxin n=1 Tax=Enterococcus cecorum TaxID=44008 RepID=UPI0032C437B0